MGFQCRFPQVWHSQPPESRTWPGWTNDFVAQFEQVTLTGFVHPPALGDDLTGIPLSFGRAARPPLIDMLIRARAETADNPPGSWASPR